MLNIKRLGLFQKLLQSLVISEFIGDDLPVLDLYSWLQRKSESIQLQAQAHLQAQLRLRSVHV